MDVGFDDCKDIKMWYKDSLVAVAVIAVCVEFCSPTDSRFEAFWSHISPVLIDRHWLPYPQRVIYEVSMLMCKSLKCLAPAYFVAFRTKGSTVSGRSALKSAVRGDLVVPGHGPDWGLRAFAVAGSSCRNEFSVELRNLPVDPETSGAHSKTHLFGVGFFSDESRFFEDVYNILYGALSGAILIQ